MRLTQKYWRLFEFCIWNVGCTSALAHYFRFNANKRQNKTVICRCDMTETLIYAISEITHNLTLLMTSFWDISNLDVKTVEILLVHLDVNF